MPVPSVARWVAGVAGLLLLFLAGRSAVRTYQAQRRVEAMTAESLVQATQLAPADSNAWARLGARLEQQGDDLPAAGRALERAVALNAYNVPALLDLALHCEFQGETDRALGYLEKANRLSRSYASRWALANFYLRQDQMDRFWPAIHEAIRLNRTDPAAAFELCWRASTDPDEILSRAIPDDLSVRRQYFAFLTSRGDQTAAARLWKQLESRLEPADLEMGLRYVDLLLAGRKIEDAVGAWNRLCARRLLACSPLDPDRGPLASNRRFSLVPLGQGFDWRLEPHDGIDTAVTLEAGEPALAARFNGAHPERAVVIWQWAPVLPRRAYRLAYRYQTQGLTASTGLRWAVRDETVPGRSADLVVGESLRARNDDWSRGAVAFRTGPATRLVRLEFFYQRAPGTTRAEGSVALQEVDLQPADGPAAGADLSGEGRP